MSSFFMAHWTSNGSLGDPLVFYVVELTFLLETAGE